MAPTLKAKRFKNVKLRDQAIMTRLFLIIDVALKMEKLKTYFFTLRLADDTAQHTHTFLIQMLNESLIQCPNQI